MYRTMKHFMREPPLFYYSRQQYKQKAFAINARPNPALVNYFHQMPKSVNAHSHADVPAVTMKSHTAVRTMKTKGYRKCKR